MLQNIIKKRKTLCSIIEQQNIEYNNNINNILIKHKKYNEKLNKDFNNNNNTLNLIQNLEKIVNIYLTKNQYIIIHDICGNKFKNPIIINEGDKRIEFKRNDTRYGSNIYIYQDNILFLLEYNSHLELLEFLILGKILVHLNLVLTMHFFL